MAVYKALLDLASLLKGRPEPPNSWVETVNLANRVLLTPALARAVGSCSELPPTEIVEFLEAIAARNRERNERLRGQLAEAARALASVAVVPTLLNGGGWLIAAGPQRDERMLSDLDLLVAPDEVAPAIAALEGAGFRLIRRFDEDDSHVAAEFGREGDVGMIDLHRRPPGPRHILAAPNLAERVEITDFAGLELRLPRPELRILHLAMHDQLHDGDYWGGVLDLRHLHDTADIARAEGVDWSFFQGAWLGGLGRRALERHLAGAAELFGADVAPGMIGVGAKEALRRSLIQLDRPLLRPLVTAARIVATTPWAIAHYERERQWRVAEARAPSTAVTRVEGRIARLRQVFGSPSSVKL